MWPLANLFCFLGDTEEKVAVEDVDSLLSNMGIHLTKEQLQEALKNVTVDGEWEKR